MFFQLLQFFFFLFFILFFFGKKGFWERVSTSPTKKGEFKWGKNRGPPPPPPHTHTHPLPPFKQLQCKSDGKGGGEAHLKGNVIDSLLICLCITQCHYMLPQTVSKSYCVIPRGLFWFCLLFFPVNEKHVKRNEELTCIIFPDLQYEFFWYKNYAGNNWSEHCTVNMFMKSFSINS